MVSLTVGLTFKVSGGKCNDDVSTKIRKKMTHKKKRVQPLLQLEISKSTCTFLFPYSFHITSLSTCGTGDPATHAFGDIPVSRTIVDPLHFKELNFK